MTKRADKQSNLIDIGVIFKYLVLSAAFTILIHVVNQTVLYAVSISPTNQVGNGGLTLYEVHNTGAAFNLLSNQPQALIVFSLIVLAVILFVVVTKSARLNHNAISSMALLSSGIFMNMMERISHGYVIDYINCNFAPNIPVFNTADILIVCGAIGIILALFSKN